MRNKANQISATGRDVKNKHTTEVIHYGTLFEAGQGREWFKAQILKSLSFANASQQTSKICNAIICKWWRCQVQTLHQKHLGRWLYPVPRTKSVDKWPLWCAYCWLSPWFDLISCTRGSSLLFRFDLTRVDLTSLIWFGLIKFGFDWFNCISLYFIAFHCIWYN